mmetsp:Transcript_7700/g.11347  ORF Transcript_7700/g.11347 Transcript_7700/m.11347 type:complete len:219 (+) Transcript_7700:864-1520(+)
MNKRKRKLEGSKFRMLNEMLYTQHSQKNLKLFSESPELFEVYHKGFEEQVKEWPVNPLELVEQEIRKLSGSASTKIADLGCGNGQLELNLKDQPNIKVHSYDLVDKDHVKACDVTNLPLKSNKLDIAVFCLSLMGSNHVKMLQEAHRVLKKKGTLIIAEVESRVPHKEEFQTNMDKLGFKLQQKIQPNNFFFVCIFAKSKVKPPLPSKLLNPGKYKKR